MQPAGAPAEGVARGEDLRDILKPIALVVLGEGAGLGQGWGDSAGLEGPRMSQRGSCGLCADV